MDDSRIHYILCVVGTKVQNLAGIPWKRGIGASFLSLNQREYVKFVYNRSSKKVQFDFLYFINPTRNSPMLMNDP